MTAETRTMSARRNVWRRRLDEQRDVIIIVAILLGIVLLAGVFLPEFRTSKNVLNVLRQSVALGLVSVGQTSAILVGGIDLSVGAAISLVDVYATGFMANFTAPWMVGGMVVALLLLGIIVGFVNATIITRFKLAPFIATMGVGAVLQGLVLQFAKKPGGKIAPGWEFFAEGKVGPIPFPVIFLL